MENIRLLLAKGLIGGGAIAAVFAGFSGFLYLLYRLIKFLRPKEVRQEEKRIFSHRFYRTSGRGRVAYLILCLEETLRFYKQDFTAWEWFLRRLWTIASCPEPNWMGAWLDSIGELLPSMVLNSSTNETTSASAVIREMRSLYMQAGYAMIVINAIIENAYTMVGQWSPNVTAHDPEGLFLIDKTEKTMQAFGVPFPSNVTTQLLFGQRDSSFGEPFDGLQMSCLSAKEHDKAGDEPL